MFFNSRSTMDSNRKLELLQENKEEISKQLPAVCRTCLNGDNDVDGELYQIEEIYLEEDMFVSQIQSFEEILCLFVDDEIGKHDTRLPKSICLTCVEKARSAFQFIEMCRRTDVMLKECLSSEKNTDSKKENITIHTKPENFALEVLNDAKKLLVEEKKQNICEVCHKTFSQPQTLNRHRKIHSKDTQPGKPCNYCDRVFLRSDDLRRHMRTHTNERPYACDLCSKAYKQSNELKEHKASAHSEKGSRRMYPCTLCDKQLGTRNGLYVHMKVHRGEKNHSCSFCDKRFVTSGELTSHLRHIHTFEINAEVFNCHVDGCNKNFVTKSALRHHHSNKHIVQGSTRTKV
ncbi:zinc finger protein 595-like isoform X2 [Topomyia yanbarensis]|uniref:zinc finger protein 595-like isoform X2 n=1 Tax=Topomyia yanbarensis TaxID=2498891 RepID=UPI00273B6F42|nr:zinc finger protein 595-like isoform X2 [Topomyia yanbarensis]